MIFEYISRRWYQTSSFYAFVTFILLWVRLNFLFQASAYLDCKKLKLNIKTERTYCVRYLPYALAMDTLASTDTSGMIIMADRISYNISGSVTVVFPDVYPKGGNCSVGNPGLAESIWITNYFYCSCTYLTGER